MTTQFAVMILAGGQSSRMGRDKALIEIQGVPLLQRIWTIAHACSSEIYVVTSRPEQYRSLLPETCHFIAEAIVQGPLVGFAQGLPQVQAEWVLLLACDLPRLQSETLQGWGKALRHVPETAIALLPKQAKGWEPLCGFYRRECLPALTEFIQQGGRSFQAWLSQHPVWELIVTDPQMLLNCNTPSDLKQLQEDLALS